MFLFAISDWDLNQVVLWVLYTKCLTGSAGFKIKCHFAFKFLMQFYQAILTQTI